MDSADIWTKINPLSNVAMIVGHSLFYKNIVIAIAAVLSADEPGYWAALSLGVLFGGLPAIILTYCDYIQNTTLQKNDPTVDNQNIDLNKKGKILAGFCRFHYATESNTPGVQGLEQWFRISPGSTLIACFIGLLFSFISTAADTDSIKGELKVKFSNNPDSSDETDGPPQPNRFSCC